MFVFKDGIREAADIDYNLYSEKRLVEFLKVNHTLSANDLVNGIFTDVHGYSKNMEQSDDITALAVRYDH